jgi:hypothetical protein
MVPLVFWFLQTYHLSPTWFHAFPCPQILLCNFNFFLPVRAFDDLSLARGNLDGDQCLWTFFYDDCGFYFNFMWTLFCILTHVLSEFLLQLSYLGAFSSAWSCLIRSILPSMELRHMLIRSEQNFLPKHHLQINRADGVLLVMVNE